uniref:Uncharacterized protein n=1 Tax=Anguilla anguilla TaxID=7936 RepID=A0A0E9XI73_ANGAN
MFYKRLIIRRSRSIRVSIFES